ncbi:MAG: signal peptide peptidase SppA [Deltaproteobacteria bacterium]|nr:MAG: signal peptide peptidase SppA [Deltaproteobacteria bacterium]
MTGKGEDRKRRSPLARGCLILLLAVFAFFLVMGIIGRVTGPVGISGEGIGVVKIEGIIEDSSDVTEVLRDFGKNEKIKAVVIRINSPGGGVGPSQEIYEEVRKLSEKKVVVASIGAVGASGGYYIACGADKIVANPGSITGSIGVIMNFLNVKELLEKIGVKGFVLKSGEMKDIGNPLREMTEKEKKLLNELIGDIHSQFVEAVAAGRKLEKEKVERIADGRIFSGSQAKKLGLVDSLGNFYDAVDVAAKLAGIEGEPKLVYPPGRKVTLLDLIRNEVKSIIDEIKVEILRSILTPN